MTTLPTLTLKRLNTGRIIATDLDGVAHVCSTRNELEEYLDQWEAECERTESTLAAFNEMMGNPMDGVNELIESVKA